MAVEPQRELESEVVNMTEEPQQGMGRETTIYSHRFTGEEEATRRATWKVLCSRFFQRYVRRDDTVVDLGAGDGHFITNIFAGKRFAVDLSPHVLELEGRGVTAIVARADAFAGELGTQADVVFMSNFLEHLPSRRTVLEVFEECARALKPGGRVIILQPNIRYVGSAYWDYIDHHIALTEDSLVEALEVSGFAVEELIPRFLPYTAKSFLGRLAGGRPWCIELYLLARPLWRFFGQQTLVVARRSGAGQQGG